MASSSLAPYLHPSVLHFNYSHSPLIDDSIHSTPTSCPFSQVMVHPPGQSTLANECMHCRCLQGQSCRPAVLVTW
jgi:hypothetical protein